MKTLLLTIVALLCISSCSSTPTPRTILKPDVTKPIVVGGCEKAKQREDKHVDC